MVVLTTGGLFAMALWALPWVRDESGSLAADFAVLSWWAVLAFGAAWSQVRLLCPLDQPTTGDEALSVGSALQAKTVLRSFLVIVALIGNLVWSDLVAGEFWFGHYARSGVQATALRSPESETRRWAIARIAESADPAIEQHVRLLAPLRQDEDLEVRADAIAALGHLVWRMRKAVEILQREATDRGRFEPRVLQAAEEALDDPARWVQVTGGTERRAWIYAAGALGDPSAVPVLGRLSQSEEPADAVAAVGALADIASEDALPILADLMANHPGEAGVHASWAMGLIMAFVVGKEAAGASQVPEYAAARDVVRARLSRVEPEKVCAFLRWFPEIADASLTGALVEVARSRIFLSRCKRMERPRWFGPPEAIVQEVEVSEMVLRAMASVAVGNPQLHLFLEEAVTTEGLPEAVRARMKEILDEIERAE